MSLRGCLLDEVDKPPKARFVIVNDAKTCTQVIVTAVALVSTTLMDYLSLIMDIRNDNINNSEITP